MGAFPSTGWWRTRIEIGNGPLSDRTRPRLCKNKITVSYKSILKESTLAILQTLSTMGILGRFLPGSQLVHRFYTASTHCGHTILLVAVNRLPKADLPWYCARPTYA
jgi:hypothetical protein